LYEEALRLCPVEHKYRHFSLDKLGGALLARFNQRGDVNDIISLRREALTLCSLGNPSRHSTLSNPALRTRYVKLNTSGDLDEAINLFRDWLRLVLHVAIDTFAICTRHSVLHQGNVIRYRVLQSAL